ncbi:S49 family peptidase [Shewanella bicestrii]|uniref:S49 family peptidase n=1 Tax=Shewanella xiamenensis TaxID=332186 RepID=UPI00217ED45E|nr:S49 family peptidase [Shewanella xiamenensis]MCT8868995.1 S49 family peptidase [Shewanella xiamenensis]MCT8873680.1 S49 family peptidase [Shewanella xiamenensis]UWH39852.1 S49 family peptidase [Shewanella xiamenensis]
MLSQNTQPELVNLLKQHLTIYKRTNYGKLILLGGVIFIGIVSNLISLIEHEDEHIAVVQISGEIGSDEDTGNGKKITDHILAAMKNEKAKVIVIEANSPGGAPTDSQTINEVIVKYKQWKAPLSQDVRATILESIENPSVMFEEIKTGKLFGDLERKPIIAVITKQCASACIQAVINADVIIAQRASLVGSIGVRMDALNWSELAGKLGITNTVITSGELKDALNPWKAIDSNQQQIIKDKILQPIFEQFKNDVLLGRGDKLKVDTEILWSGLAWTGSDAVAFGLVDITSNPIETQAALESLFGRKYQTYSKSTFNLGAFISNPFSSQF